jgi:hypothetical protein
MHKHTLESGLKHMRPWLVDREQRFNVLVVDDKFTGHGPWPKENLPLFHPLGHLLSSFLERF